MDKIWNKKDILSYELVINNVKITIHTHNQELHFAPYPKKEITSSLEIWYDSNISDKCIQNFKIVDSNSSSFFPQPIHDAYNYLRLDSEAMKNHINRYMEYHDFVYAHFCYPSDEFYIAYHQQKKEIYLWGNEANLERILISILSMTGDTLPFHAAFMYYNGKGYMIIGDTKSGKTSAALMLLKKDAVYIADDILYIDNDSIGHRCVEYISPRSSFVTNDWIQYVKFKKGDRSFIDLSSMCKSSKWRMMDAAHIDKIILINPLRFNNIKCTKLYCAFHHDSMIGLDILHDNTKNIVDLIKSSLQQWDELKLNTKLDNMYIDYNNFEDSVYSEFNRLFR